MYLILFSILKTFDSSGIRPEHQRIWRLAWASSLLQDKLDEQEAEAQLELMEEKLRLAESELHCALQRAEQAEKRSSQLVTRGDVY
jgi:hypothetical protein